MGRLSLDCGVDAARTGLRGPDWLAWTKRLKLEDDNLWAALAYAHAAPDPGIASRLGALGWYFALAERVSEGRRFLQLTLACSLDDAPVNLRIELLAGLSSPRNGGARSARRDRGGRSSSRARRDRSCPVRGRPRAGDARAR